MPLILAIVLFTGIYRYASAKRPPLRDIWPGVVVAAIGYELAKIGFTLYLDNFANYGAIYASLGSVIAFLVFTYIVAFVALLGAEFAAEWPHVRAGEHDGPPGPPFRRQVWDFVRGLFVRTTSGPRTGRAAARTGGAAGPRRPARRRARATVG